MTMVTRETVGTYPGGVVLELTEPPSANRWWRNVNGRMVTSREAREYKQRVANLCFVARIKPFAKSQPIGVRIIWRRARKSGDLDKRLGVLLDALQGCVYENDSQICAIDALRVDPPNTPGTVRVEVRRRTA